MFWNGEKHSVALNEQIATEWGGPQQRHADPDMPNSRLLRTSHITQNSTVHILRFHIERQRIGEHYPL